MERFFVCPDCACVHDNPADAGLGHLIVCLDCFDVLDESRSVLLLSTGEAVDYGSPDSAVAA